MTKISLNSLPKQLALYSKKLQVDYPQAEIYLVGGAIRDLLLKRPTKDYDLVISGLPVASLASWLKKFGKVNFVGKSFGVFKWQPRDWPFEIIDVALPRTEKTIKGTGQYRDFKITSSSNLKIEVDLKRRDFTVNALALNLLTGQLIDPSHGLIDLKNKTIKCVGKPQQRFNEDLSRALRGLRLACQLNFKIETSTLAAIKKSATKVCLRKIDNDWLVPREIVARELLKSLLANPSYAIDIWSKNNYLKLLLPEINIDLSKIKKIFSVKKQTNNYQNLNIILTALLFTSKSPDAIINRLKLTSYSDRQTGAADSNKINWLIKNLNLIKNSPSLERHEVYKLFCQDKLAGQELLTIINIYASSFGLNKQLDWQKRYKALISQIKQLDKKYPHGKFKPLLTGQGIIKITKLPPGPKIGKLIDLLVKAQLNGQINNVAQATDLIKKYAI